MEKLKTLSTTLIGGGLIVAALWASYGLFEQNESRANVGSRSDRPTPVVIAPVAFEPEHLRLDAVGTSRALRSVTLFPEIAGLVDEVAFTSGQRVEAGDLLLSLDTRDEKLALELAEVRLADAQRLAERYARAGGSDAIPITDVEAAETALKAARIERDRAQVALEDRYVRAPFAGWVGLTDVEIGDRVDPSIPVTTLDDRSSLLVNFDVPELMLGAVQAGEAVAVSPWSGTAEKVLGEVTDIGSRIDPMTRSVVARARVPNVDDRLRPGMSFRVELRIEGRDFPVVPEVALQWGAEGAYVWTLDEGRARRVGVDIVQRLEGRVLIDAELDVDDRIVTEGVQSMREGRAIDPVGMPGA